MLFSEIFNHQVELKWQKTGRYEMCEFTINDHTYQVQVEKKPLNFHLQELKGKITAEVSFFRQDLAGEDAFTTTNKTKTSSPKIYCAVANGLREKFKNYDAFYFIAEKLHSKTSEEFQSKKKIYFVMADNIRRTNGTYFYELESASKVEFLITKIKLSKETQEDTKLRNAQQVALEACGMKSIFSDSLG